jgi:hypothetical protein
VRKKPCPLEGLLHLRIGGRVDNPDAMIYCFGTKVFAF